MSAFTLALSAMAMAVSIVNRGVAAGGGNASLRFGGSILGLWRTYLKLFTKRSLSSLSPLEWLACGLFLGSIVRMGRHMLTYWKELD